MRPRIQKEFFKNHKLNYEIVENKKRAKIRKRDLANGYSESDVLTNEGGGNHCLGLVVKPLEDVKKIASEYKNENDTKKLTLEGFTGFCNGPEILHSICRELLLQKGILIARSVLKSDFTLDYNHEDYESLKKSGLICIELENEKEDFWVAYNTYLPVLETYNMQYVDVKRGLINWKILATYIEDKGKFYRNYFIRTKAIRPVIILKSQVDVGDGENFKYKWIKP